MIQKFLDDGCKYMHEDELKTLVASLMPGEFDRTTVKNIDLDINYGLHPDQLLDVYYPDDKSEGGGPYPAIFFIHGGGWILGNRKSGSIRSIIDATKNGYAVVSVEYRLYPKVKFPEFIYDVKTAIRWARAHARKYSFDPERFGIIGDSAGGYNALMAGFTANRPEYEGTKYGWEGYSSSLQAICDLFAPTDLAADNTAFYLQSGVKRFKRDEAGKPSKYQEIWGAIENSELLSLFSPTNIVREDIPPALIMHGKNDGMVAYQHSEILNERIRNICGNNRSTLMLFEGKNHADPFFFSQECTTAIIEFFDKHMK